MPLEQFLNFLEHRCIALTSQSTKNDAEVLCLLCNRDLLLSDCNHILGFVFFLCEVLLKRVVLVKC